MYAPFTGVGVALVTLFDADLAVDAAATAELAGRLVAEGVRAVVVAGSTGEADALTDAERVALVGAVRAAVPDPVPVLAGTGGAWSGEAVLRTLSCLDAGADGVLVISPRRSDDPRPYYDAVRRAVPAERTLLAYHFPGVSAPGIAVDLLPRLPIDGVKDSSGDLDRLLRTLEVFDGATYVGSSALLSAAGPLGVTGAILAVANTEPALAARALDGDAEAQQALLAAHARSSADFPHGVKRLVAERWGYATHARVGR